MQQNACQTLTTTNITFNFVQKFDTEVAVTET